MAGSVRVARPFARAGSSGRALPPPRRRPRRARRARALVVLVVAPVVALAIRAPWSDVGDLLGEPANRSALRLSLVVSVAALALSIVIGFPIAWVLARVAIPGRSPPAGPRDPADGAAPGRRRRGPARGLRPPGRARASGSTTGSGSASPTRRPPRSWPPPSSACRSSSSPWRPRCAGVDRRHEDVARTLGARPLTVLRRVTLPSIRGALGAGCGARVGPGAGRVRRHHHLRRELRGPHPDDAAGHHRAPRAGRGQRHRPQPRAAGRVGRRAGVARGPGGGRERRPLAVVGPGVQVGALTLDVAPRRCRPGATRRAGRTQRRRQDDALRVARAACLALDAGRVRLGDRVLVDPAAGVHVAPEERGIGRRLPGPLLFGHLDVTDNVAFGLQAARQPGGGPRGARPRAGSSGWAWPTARPPARASSPAARPSGWRWPGRWRPGPTPCCSTSRWPRSTPRCGPSVRRELREHLQAHAGPVPGGHPRPRRRRGAGRRGRRARGRARSPPTGTRRRPRRPPPHGVGRRAGRHEPARRPSPPEPALELPSEAAPRRGGGTRGRAGARGRAAERRRPARAPPERQPPQPVAGRGGRGGGLRRPGAGAAGGPGAARRRGDDGRRARTWSLARRAPRCGRP